MANVDTTIDIDAPVERVWEIVTDLGRTGEWVSIHRGFPTDPPADVKQGTTFQQTLAVADTTFSVDWTAVEVDGPRRLAWDGVGPAGATAHTSYSLSQENGGTRFAYANEFVLPAGKIGEAVAGVVSGHSERAANDSLARLKQIAES